MRYLFGMGSTDENENTERDDQLYQSIDNLADATLQSVESSVIMAKQLIELVQDVEQIREENQVLRQILQQQFELVQRIVNTQEEQSQRLNYHTQTLESLTRSNERISLGQEQIPRLLTDAQQYLQKGLVEKIDFLEKGQEQQSDLFSKLLNTLQLEEKKK